MNYKKGFSLLEVLISLILVTGLALSLLEQQGTTKIALSQLIAQTYAAKLIEQEREQLILKNFAEVLK